jgi:hypothetical protein
VLQDRGKTVRNYWESTASGLRLTVPGVVGSVSFGLDDKRLGGNCLTPTHLTSLAVLKPSLLTDCTEKQRRVALMYLVSSN